MTRYKENYIGYELGNFLVPKYPGSEECELFFLLLQKPGIEHVGEKITVKLGKTRKLEGPFYTDCLKVIVYLEIDGGKFGVYDINTTVEKDGTQCFDAFSFLTNLGIEFEMNDTSHFRYFKHRLRESRKELILDEEGSKFSVIHRRINVDDYERLKTFYNIS